MKKFLPALLVFLFIAPPAHATDQIVLAVHPFLSADEVEKKFTPLALYLKSQTGSEVVVKVGASYAEHIDYIGRDMVDVAYMGPSSYVQMVSAYGRKPLLARLEVDGMPSFHGNIITRADSSIKSLQDLKGRSFAYGDSQSTMSFVVPHYMLVRAGVMSENHQSHDYLGTHNNVALAVLAGDYDAGAVKPAVFKKYEARGLRSIAVTPDISEHLFVSRSNMPEKEVKKIRNAMLSIKHSKQGMQALKAIKSSITNLSPVQDSDYDNLREIMKSLVESH